MADWTLNQIQSLLDSKADPNHHDTLREALFESDESDIIELLLSSKADPNLEDIDGSFRPLHWHNDPTIIRLLLKYKANVNYASDTKQYPIYTNPSLEKARLLLEAKADTSKCDLYFDKDMGWNMLFHVITRFDIYTDLTLTPGDEIIPFASLHIPQLTTKPLRPPSPSFSSILTDNMLLPHQRCQRYRDYLDLVEYIISTKCDPNTYDKCGYPLLYYCTDPTVIKLLLHHKAIIPDNVDVMTKYLPELEPSPYEIQQREKQNESSTNDDTTKHETIMFITGSESRQVIMKSQTQKKPAPHLLLKHIDSKKEEVYDMASMIPYITPSNTSSSTASLSTTPAQISPLLSAVSQSHCFMDQHKNIERVLLLHNIDIHHTDNKHQNALYYATDPTIIQLLVCNNININIQNNTTAITPLHHVLSHDSTVHLSRSLLLLKADPSLCDTLGMSPLHNLVRMKKPEYVTNLAHCVTPGLFLRRSSAGISPLMHLRNSIYKDSIVTLLIKLLSSSTSSPVTDTITTITTTTQPTITTPSLSSLLLFPSSLHDVSTKEEALLLINAKSDVNIVQSSKNKQKKNIASSAIAATTTNDDNEILLPPLHTFLSSKSSLLSSSTIYDIVDVLLQAKANPNLCDSYGHVPLYYVYNNTNDKMIKLLLDYKATPLDTTTSTTTTSVNTTTTNNNNNNTNNNDIANIITQISNVSLDPAH